MLASLLRILALTRKELLAVLKEKRSRVSLFAPPIVQCLLFGYAATYDISYVPYAVIDRDHSAASREFLARLDGSGVFERIAEPARIDDLKTAIDTRKVLVAIIIDGDFERRLSLGEPAAVQVIADSRNSNTAGTASRYVNEIVAGFGETWAAGHGARPRPVRSEVHAWYNPNFESRWQFIPGMIATLTMLQTLLLTSMSVAREREQGTFDQLLVTPFRPLEIMAGKAIPPILIGIVQATLVMLVGRFWFNVPFSGSVMTLYTGLGLFLLASIGIGLLVSSLVSTMQQAMLFTFVLLMPFVLLSGLTTPIANMPYALQQLTFGNPLRYAVEIVQRIFLEGVGLDRLLPDLWPLAVMGVLSLAAASWLFRHRFE
ncbi:MAG: ABC transporter permease [Telmatospirillum sp.]|nr:ABC transporter permease [Telmatospirillum sp.]